MGRAPITHTKLAIAMLAVASTQIHAIGHDPSTNTLAVEFKGKNGPGDPYYYDNVTPEVYQEFVEAKSKGKFFGDRIQKNQAQYPCRKYVPEEKTEREAA